MNRVGWVLIGVLAGCGAAQAQQSQVSISTATQVYAADQYRMAGQQRIEPDLGVAWVRPQTFGGTLGLDLNLTRRNNSLQLGRGLVSLKDLKTRGWSLDVSAGDTGSKPFVPDFGFSNLSAPIITYAGATVTASNERMTVRAGGGRTTQTRNIFGTDLVDLSQNLFQADITVKLSGKVQLSSRGSRVSNGDVQSYPTFVDWSEDIGSGIIITPGRGWQFSADAGLSRFQRRGAATTETSPSWLVGALVSGTKGRFEINAQRFSVGRFAAANYPYNDRQGVFATGEWIPREGARLFGGADISRTNLNPEASAKASLSMPDSIQTRGFGGVRLRVSKQSNLTLRAEGGGREINASRFSPGYESDSGSLGAEWQGTFKRATVVTRYDRRTNVDSNYSQSSFHQHEVSSQLYFHLNDHRELFVQGFLLRRANRVGGGETDWYASAGLQTRLKQLQGRLEGTIGRTDDWDSTISSNRQLIVAGLSGQIARQLSVSADIMLNHAPLALANSHAWYTRAIIRVTRTMTYGTPMLAVGSGALPMVGPMGSVAGQVFVDWDGDGLRSEGDDPVPGVSLMVVRVGSSPTTDAGNVTFSRVPVGDRLVSLDTSTVPADYDLPSETSRTVDVQKGKRSNVEFGLIPVGSIRGMVYTDTDGSGMLSDADQPREDVVIVLNDGERSELVREGQFDLQNLRLGTHEVSVDLESLGADSRILGDRTQPVTLSRDRRAATVVFLVKNEKPAEVRKVFTPRKKTSEPSPAAVKPAPSKIPTVR